jgi:sugar phosphate permease
VATIVACTIASSAYREPVELQGERISVSGLFSGMVAIARDARLILITLTSVALIAAQIGVMAFLTLTLVHEAAYAVPLAVSIFALSQVAAIAGRLSWGWSSDRVFRGSRVLPLACCAAITAVVCAAVASITTATPLWAIAVLAAALGFTAEGWLGVGVIAIAEIGGEEHSGSALGVGLTWIFLGAFVSPTVLGALAEAHGYPFVWRSLAFVQVVGIVPALLASSAIRRAARREEGIAA